MFVHIYTTVELDASAEEKEIIDLTGRLISVIAAKDFKEYSLVTTPFHPVLIKHNQ